MPLVAPVIAVPQPVQLLIRSGENTVFSWLWDPPESPPASLETLPDFPQGSSWMPSPLSVTRPPKTILPQRLHPTCVPGNPRPRLPLKPELAPGAPPASWTLPPPSTPESHTWHL